MKLNWKTDVSGGLCRNTWKYIEDHNKFIITEISNKVYWLHFNNNFIGNFSTLKKAQKVAELISEG